MFNNLFKLYRTSTLKTPLEDFTTEGLAGILQLNEDIRKSFCLNFLSLPEDNYKIETQYFQAISDNKPNCIVDLVIIGKKHVAFIENKVESSEGIEQLLRYKLALQQNQVEKEKYLFYSTKYADPKDLNDFTKPEDFKVNFNQFRWYEVAKFLNQYKDIPLVQSYLEFLTSHKMSQDNTIKSEHLVAMENMRKTIDVVEFYIENSKPDFRQYFLGVSLNKNASWDEIRVKDRLCYYSENVLNSDKKAWSEVLYAIEFSTLNMIAQIYVDKNHEFYNKYLSLPLLEGFIKIEFEFGTAIQLNTNLGTYLNKPNADKLIRNWYLESFKKIHELIQSQNHLKWNTVASKEA